MTFHVQVLKGLEYLHSRKYAHRDLKSSNIMMTVHGDVKLSKDDVFSHKLMCDLAVDFGLCVDMSSGPKHHMIGSPFWMPPEMIQNRTHGIPVSISFMTEYILLLDFRFQSTRTHILVYRLIYGALQFVFWNW